MFYLDAYKSITFLQYYQFLCVCVLRVWGVCMCVCVLF